jgi:hypothetical protein
VRQLSVFAVSDRVDEHCQAHVSSSARQCRMKPAQPPGISLTGKNRVVVKKANHLFDSRWWLAYDMILHTRCTEKDGLLLFTFCDLMDTYDIIEARSEGARYVVSLS